MSRTSQHNGLTISLPDKWEDQTVVTLMGPKPAGLQMMTAQRSESEQPNVVIKREILPGSELTAADFAGVQQSVMEQLMNECQLLEEGTLTLQLTAPPIEAVTREYSFSAPVGIMRQLHIYFRIDDAFFMFCGTAKMDMHFDSLRKQFLDIIGQLQLDRSQL